MAAMQADTTATGLEKNVKKHQQQQQQPCFTVRSVGNESDVTIEKGFHKSLQQGILTTGLDVQYYFYDSIVSASDRTGVER